MKDLLMNMTIMDIIDIAIVAVIIYKFLNFLKETRGAQLVKGILVLIVMTIITQFLKLYTIHWILSEVMTVGLLALVIIFQPELRRLLENIGKKRITDYVMGTTEEESEVIVREMTRAVRELSASRTGALIVIERDAKLLDIIETGTEVRSKIKDQVIKNIFYKGAPLHDGAMIIRKAEIFAAGCVLPLTQEKNLPANLGTRHRAAIGMSENSDAFIIVVSEETGTVSICEDGRIRVVDSSEDFENELRKIYFAKEKKNAIVKVKDMLLGKTQEKNKGDQDDK